MVFHKLLAASQSATKFVETKVHRFVTLRNEVKRQFWVLKGFVMVVLL